KPKPTLTVNPQHSLYTGDTVTLTCDLQEGTGWKFHWYTNNQSPSGELESTNTLTVTVDRAGEIEYCCEAYRGDDYTELSDVVQIIVKEKPKPELTSSRTGAVLSGTSVTLTCTLEPQSTGWTFYWNTSTQSNETETESETNSYTIRLVDESSRGRYQCRAGRGDPVYYTHYSNELQLEVT
ncbi:carcinoembryonic antigen-related cell adhesion molecule 5-like, partial [Clarias magur]